MAADDKTHGGTAERWLGDMPQQFLGKRNIEVLVRTFARQLDEIWRVFEDLTEKTGIDTAVSQNLDLVGTIIPLTRKEAGEMAGIGVLEPVISDERYRLFLRYQLLRNTSECTYQDLIDGIELLWGYNRIHYREDPEHPAVIIFQTDRMDLDEEDLIEFHPELCIRPAGVGVTLRKHFGGSYEVPVRYSERIHFRTSFYPRYNLPQLKLNGKWKLNGGRKLSGYDSQETVDLYPVAVRFRAGAKAAVEEVSRIHLLTRAGIPEGIHGGTGLLIRNAVRHQAATGQKIRIRVETEEAAGEKTQVCVQTEAREEARTHMGIAIRSKAGCEAESKERLRVNASAACAAEAGEIRIYNKNLLGGGWKLNGGRKLNGGTETR